MYIGSKKKTAEKSLKLDLNFDINPLKEKYAIIQKLKKYLIGYQLSQQLEDFLSRKK
jgi:hypothetical protein